MHINCDIGERGAEHPVDRELMNHISMANIACGGHAGDKESIAAFISMADEKNISIAAHFSYPDRENFGRVSMDLSERDLLCCLDGQYAMIEGVKAVKFHGALYNDCWSDRALSLALGKWLKAKGIEQVITPWQSCLAEVSLALGMDVLYEAFAERRYAYNPDSGQLSLVSRKLDYASIHELDEALVHVRNIVDNGLVEGYTVKEDGSTVRREVGIKADTICIHSDSAIALELAASLSGMNQG